jgi:hypothetical protein
MTQTSVPPTETTQQLISDLYGDCATVQAAQDAVRADVRQVWREAVADVADRAAHSLPTSNGRIAKAMEMVIAGDVELLDDGRAKVASQSNGKVTYHVVNGSCDYKDFPRAPEGFCKHRLAYGIHKRALALAKERLAAHDQASAPAPVVDQAPSTPALPEAPVSITLKATLNGHEVLVTLRRTDFASVKAQVEQASQWLSTQSAPADTQVCAKHGVPMQRYEKDGRTWYSHKTAGGWCKGR